MKLARSGLRTRRLAVMAVCLVLVIVCSGFAVQAWALLISFDGRPSETAEEGLRGLAIVAAGLAVVALVEGFVAKSWWSAGIVGVHAALTLAHPNLWLLTALPTIVALLVIIIVRMPVSHGDSSSPHVRLAFDHGRSDY